MSKKYSRYESTTFSRNKTKKNDKHPYNPNRRKGKLAHFAKEQPPRKASLKHKKVADNEQVQEVPKEMW